MTGNPLLCYAGVPVHLMGSGSSGSAVTSISGSRS